MTVFILPTKGPETYRGKYPTRARSVGFTRSGGRHVELNNGVRLWSISDRSAEFNAAARYDDYAAILSRAVPMTAEQYAELRRAAEIERDIINIAGNTRRDAMREQARAIRLAIKAETTATAEPDAPAAPIKLTGFAKEPESIDMTPTWAALMPALIAALQNGTGEGRRIASEELTKLAATVDAVNAKAKAESSLFVVVSRTVDGTEYFGPLGWGDRQLAAVMSEADATAIAAKEEERAAPNREPESGRYQIKAAPYQGPSLYTVADYDAAESFSDQMGSLYGHMFRKGPES